jgi:hypothetical protein
MSAAATKLQSCKKTVKLNKCQGKKIENNKKKSLSARKTPVMKSDDFYGRAT